MEECMNSLRIVLSALLLTIPLSGADIFGAILKGTVQDSLVGRPLSGVIVTVKGTAVKTATDAEGKFTLNYSTGIINLSSNRKSGRSVVLFAPSSRVIRCNADEKVHISICTVSGETVADRLLGNQESPQDISALRDGIYLLRLSFNGGCYRGKLMLAGPIGELNVEVDSKQSIGSIAKMNAIVTLVYTKSDFYLTKEVPATLGDTSIRVKLNGWPNAANTGPQGTLTRWTGSTTFSTPNALIQNAEISACGMFCVVINASRITFRNCRFIATCAADGSCADLVHLNATGSHTLFEDCEFDGRDVASRTIGGSPNGPGDSMLVVRRCNLHNTCNGVEVSQYFRIEDSYIWDIWDPHNFGCHNDGIQSANGTISDMTIRHSTIFNMAGGTSCIMINTTNVTNVIINNNLIGGGGYTMYTYADNQLTNYKITNNWFTTRIWPKVGYWGIWYGGSSVVWPVRSGNSIWETGASVNQ
jgi:hypothetical protein